MPVEKKPVHISKFLEKIKSIKQTVPDTIIRNRVSPGGIEKPIPDFRLRYYFRAGNKKGRTQWDHDGDFLLARFRNKYGNMEIETELQACEYQYHKDMRKPNDIKKAVIYNNLENKIVKEWEYGVLVYPVDMNKIKDGQ